MYCLQYKKVRGNYKKDGNICKNCYKIQRKKYNNNTFSGNDNIKKKRKVVDFVINHNRTFIIGLSNCGKTYLMNHILYQIQEPIFVITKSINQCPNINNQTSDGIEPLEKMKTVLLILMKCYHQNEKAISIRFSLAVVLIILIYTTHLKVIFTYRKIIFVTILT